MTKHEDFFKKEVSMICDKTTKCIFLPLRRFLDGKECEDDALFSLNLLLQAGYDKSKQEELLGKLGASFKLIESVLGTLTKFRGIVSKENTGTTPTMKELPKTQ